MAYQITRFKALISHILACFVPKPIQTYTHENKPIKTHLKTTAMPEELEEETKTDPTPNRLDVKELLGDIVTDENIMKGLRLGFQWLVKKFQDGSFRPFLRKRIEAAEKRDAAIIAYILKRDGVDLGELVASAKDVDFSKGMPHVGSNEHLDS